MFLSLFYVKNNDKLSLKYAIILFINANNCKNIIPVIEGRAVVYLLWNVSKVKVDYWLEGDTTILSSHSNK